MTRSQTKLWITSAVKPTSRKLIRTIGEPRQRFTEDKLRLLRCVRFASNLEFEIEPATASPCEKWRHRLMWSARNGFATNYSRSSRVECGRGFELLDEAVCSGKSARSRGNEGHRAATGVPSRSDVFQHTKLMLDLMSRRRAGGRAYHDQTEAARVTHALQRRGLS